MNENLKMDDQKFLYKKGKSEIINIWLAMKIIN